MPLGGSETFQMRRAVTKRCSEETLWSLTTSAAKWVSQSSRRGGAFRRAGQKSFLHVSMVGVSIVLVCAIAVGVSPERSVVAGV